MVLSNDTVSLHRRHACTYVCRYLFFFFVSRPVVGCIGPLVIFRSSLRATGVGRRFTCILWPLDKVSVLCTYLVGPCGAGGGHYGCLRGGTLLPYTYTSVNFGSPVTGLAVGASKANTARLYSRPRRRFWCLLTIHLGLYRLGHIISYFCITYIRTAPPVVCTSHRFLSTLLGHAKSCGCL